MPDEPPISPDFVRACYAHLLGRAPENQAVVAEKTGLASHQAVLEAFLATDEYRRRFPQHFWDNYYAGQPPVAVMASAWQLRAMFDRIQREWAALGDQDPYWSVLTADQYRGQELDAAARAAFFESGAQTASAIDAFSQRAEVQVRQGVCLEFGCGVGRVTRDLARRFDRVVAVDISPANLELCGEVLKQEGVANVDCRLLTSPSDVEDLPRFDFLFSTIVFQHNPPPVQAYLLDVLLAKINGGGAFLFQAPTATPGYAFDTDDYLASKSPGMEMHCLPMATVFRLLAKHGLTPLEVVMDGWTGLYGSHTFFGAKASP
jgi:SAM-dependent methyltransferase